MQATNVWPLQASCFSSLSFWCFFWGMAAQSHWILWWRRKQVLTREKRNPELWRGAGGIKTYSYSCLFMTLRSREHMRSCCSLSCLLIGISLVPPYKRANLFYNPHPLQSLLYHRDHMSCFFYGPCGIAVLPTATLVSLRHKPVLLCEYWWTGLQSAGYLDPSHTGLETAQYW